MEIFKPFGEATRKLLVLAGADVHCKIVEAAKKMGIYTIVTDYLAVEDSPAKQIADEYWQLNITDVDAIVNRCKEEQVDAVLAFCIDPAQIPYQQVCERLNIPCYGTADQFAIMTNKRRFKDFCIKHGVDVIPEYSLEDIKGDDNQNVKYPVLVKPSVSRGSRGQFVCNSAEEVDEAYPKAAAESSDGLALIERYMLGKQDMSFSYVVIGGEPYLLKIGDRILGNPEDNLERQQIATILPSVHTEEYRQKIEPNVKNMIKALGLDFGAVFLQGFYDDGHVYMYDPGLRFPGSDFDIVLRDTTGYDNMSTFVKFALTGDCKSQQGDPNGAYKLNGHCCLILSIASRPGIIAKFKGFDEIKSNPFVVSAGRRAFVGDEIPSTGDIKQRVAEFVVNLPSRDQVTDFIEWVYSKLKILDTEGHDMIISKVNSSNLNH